MAKRRTISGVYLAQTKNGRLLTKSYDNNGSQSFRSFLSEVDPAGLSAIEHKDNRRTLESTSNTMPSNVNIYDSRFCLRRRGGQYFFSLGSRAKLTKVYTLDDLLDEHRRNVDSRTLAEFEAMSESMQIEVVLKRYSEYTEILGGQPEEMRLFSRMFFDNDKSHWAHSFFNLNVAILK